ncbi:hypothetical protein IW261DRAFT_1590041 [Armillaria novae-zelandiae]|uniref:Uncharacterized protein n=1 Tax=Armillaria novae-zelandiae TaxID=153914 RepID=A0AA39PQ72_9AGAR|nr:hypothetical protein IW261DRAFT_1590041 [Armillaria novae-zelandiae]
MYTQLREDERIPSCTSTSCSLSSCPCGGLLLCTHDYHDLFFAGFQGPPRTRKKLVGLGVSDQRRPQA